MPRTKTENQIISSKIQRLIGEGYETKQATAIALRMWRDGELRGSPKSKTKSKTKRSPYQLGWRARRLRAELLGRR